MKYVESLGKTPFDWRGFLDKENKTQEEITEAEYLVGSYLTSPTGNLSTNIPRLSNGRPEDISLVNLDAFFEEEVLSGNYRNATMLLDMIENSLVWNTKGTKQIVQIENKREYEEYLENKPSYTLFFKDGRKYEGFNTVDVWGKNDSFLIFTRINGDQEIVRVSEVLRIRKN